MEVIFIVFLSRFDLSKLCGTTQSQTGKKDNFDCLMSQLSEISSPSCLDSLLARGGYYFRKLDIGIDFYQFCSADVKKEQCASSEVMKSDSEGEFTKLTELLFCLGKESVLLSEGCEQEVELLRERFIGEETVSVEFARACETARYYHTQYRLIGVEFGSSSRVVTHTKRRVKLTGALSTKLSLMCNYFYNFE